MMKYYINIFYSKNSDGETTESLRATYKGVWAYTYVRVAELSKKARR